MESVSTKRQNKESSIHTKRQRTSIQQTSSMPSSDIYTGPTNVLDYVVNAQTPEELTHCIVTDPRTIYGKQQVLQIVAKLNKLLAPKFDQNCAYIN